jgi:hypothetical protein
MPVVFPTVDSSIHLSDPTMAVFNGKCVYALPVASGYSGILIHVAAGMHLKSGLCDGCRVTNRVPLA